MDKSLLDNPADLQNNPTLIVQAINELLTQARFLAEHYRHLTSAELTGSIPERVTEPTRPASSNAYNANGLSDPRSDGAVRSKAWDDAITEALHSTDPVTRAWGEGNEKMNRRWIFIQDTLVRTDLTPQQRQCIELNCARARFMSGLLGKGTNLSAWVASPVGFDDLMQIPKLLDQNIEDAFSLPSDMRYPNGSVTWRGTTAADMPAFAKNSLAHFILTSGRSVLLNSKR